MIIIPKKINIGYRNLSSSEKLAFITYFDNTNVLRKKTSWDNWRDKNIPNSILENNPIDGFIINKKVGGDSWSYWTRQTYIRVYDSRGFYFEITIENLSYIIQNTIIENGIIKEKLIYGWDGTKLLLIPTNSLDYKEIYNFSNNLNENKKISAKNLIIGATYLSKFNEKLIYLGKYSWNTPESIYFYSDKICSEFKNKNPESWTIYDNHAYRNKEEKRFIFVNEQNEFIGKKDLSKFLINIINDTKHKNYENLLNKYIIDVRNSPMNFKSIKEKNLTFEEFKTLLYNNQSYHFYNINNKRFYIQYNKNTMMCIIDYKSQEKTLEEVFKEIQPVVRKIYLKNGNLYKEFDYAFELIARELQ